MAADGNGPPMTPEFYVKLREEEAAATNTLLLFVKLPGVEGAGDCHVHSSAGPLTVSVDGRDTRGTPTGPTTNTVRQCGKGSGRWLVGGACVRAGWMVRG